MTLMNRIDPTVQTARRRQATFRKRDLRVLIETMKEAGLSIARIEISADGQISVVHGPPVPANAPPERHPWDED